MKSYNDAGVITPSDTVDLARRTQGIWVGGAGIVVAVLESGQTVNLTCVAGSLVPLKVRRVNAASTTATLLVALYEV
jgi:hypothetical protein